MKRPRCANECMRMNRGTMVEYMSTLFVMKRSFGLHTRTDGIEAISGYWGTEYGIVHLPDPSDHINQGPGLLLDH